MTAEQALEIAQNSLVTLLYVSGPLMLVALAVGLLVALFQALTSIQEITLTFVPKILLVFVALLFLLPFMSGQMFALAEDLVSLLKNVQIEYRVAVSLGSFIRQAIALREPWISNVCARGRLCKPPDHWSRNRFQDPPSDAEFPAEIAEKFDDGQPWFNAMDELSCGDL